MQISVFKYRYLQLCIKCENGLPYNTTHTCSHAENTYIHTYTKMNLSTVKWAQWDETQSRDLLSLFICVCIALCTIIAHNIVQNRPDNFPSYPPDNHHCSDDVYLREGGLAFRTIQPFSFVNHSVHAVVNNCWINATKILWRQYQLANSAFLTDITNAVFQHIMQPFVQSIPSFAVK